MSLERNDIKSPPTPFSKVGTTRNRGGRGGINALGRRGFSLPIFGATEVAPIPRRSIGNE
jgi:hypothetical protein